MTRGYTIKYFITIKHFGGSYEINQNNSFNSNFGFQAVNKLKPSTHSKKKIVYTQ